MDFPTPQKLTQLPREAVVKFAAYCARFAFDEFKENSPDLDRSLIEPIMEALELAESAGCQFSVSPQAALVLAQKANQSGDNIEDPADAVAYSAACAAFVVKYFLDQNPSEAVMQAMYAFKNAQYFVSSKDDLLRGCCQILDNLTRFAQDTELDENTLSSIDDSQKDSLFDDLTDAPIPVLVQRELDKSTSLLSLS